MEHPVSDFHVEQYIALHKARHLAMPDLGATN